MLSYDLLPAKCFGSSRNETTPTWVVRRPRYGHAVSVPNLLLLAGAGFLAGAMNAAAGGGSFVSFPAMVFAGVPPVYANASSTVALFPGSVTSGWAYRELLGGIGDYKGSGYVQPAGFASRCHDGRVQRSRVLRFGGCGQKRTGKAG